MMQQQMMLLANMVDESRGTNYAQQIAAGIAGGSPVSPVTSGENTPDIEQAEALGGKEGEAEATNTKKARQRVADSTSPT